MESITRKRLKTWIIIFTGELFFRANGLRAGKIKKCLDELEKKTVRVSQNGFIINQFFMEKMIYKIQSDILNLRDMTKEVYLSLNLNQVYQIDIGKNNIILFLDNDTEIQLSL